MATIQIDKSKGDRTRERVIDAAAALINARGLAGTSVGDIIEATGVKKGNLYFHFGSKEEIGIAVLEKARREYFDYLANNARGDSPLARLNGVIEAVARFHRKTGFTGGCIFGNTALETGDSNPRFAAFVRAVFDEWTGLLARLLAGARDAGEIPNTIEPAAFARLIVASLEGGIMMARLSKNERDLIQCIDAIRSALGLSATTPGRRDITRKGKGKC